MKKEMKGFIEMGILKKKLKIEVIVKDKRTIFGRTEYLVEPVCGSGRIWVQKLIK